MICNTIFILNAFCHHVPKTCLLKSQPLCEFSRTGAGNLLAIVGQINTAHCESELPLATWPLPFFTSHQRPLLIPTNFPTTRCCYQLPLISQLCGLDKNYLVGWIQSVGHKLPIPALDYTLYSFWGRVCDLIMSYYDVYLFNI